MVRKIKRAAAVLIVAVVGVSSLVFAYKKGVAKGYAAVDAISKLQASANKYSHDKGFYEGQKAGMEMGENATAADYCGYVGMLSRAADKRAGFYKGLNEKYVYNAKDRETDNDMVDRMADYIHAAYREECKKFSGEQIEGFIKNQEKG